MTYEAYRYIFIGGAILAAVMLLVSLFLFIRFQIPRVIGDITGSTVKKAVRRYNRQSSVPGFNRNSPRLDNFTEGSHSPDQRNIKSVKKSTAPLYQGGQGNNPENNKTTPLLPENYINGNNTAILPESPPEPYGRNFNSKLTMPLSMLSSQHYTDEGEMTVQFGAPEAAAEAFEVEKDITFIHTDEVIV